MDHRAQPEQLFTGVTGALMNISRPDSIARLGPGQITDSPGDLRSAGRSFPSAGAAPCTRSHSASARVRQIAVWATKLNDGRRQALQHPPGLSSGAVHAGSTCFAT